MDAMILILTALQTERLVGSKDRYILMSDTAKDMYTNLKIRILQKFAGNASAELVLTEYETDPKTWEVPLKKALVQAQADQDQDIIEAAQKVLQFALPRQTVIGKYNIQVSGTSQGFALGNLLDVG